ncbi:class I SAM-dependent methyltransferase [Pseudochryseolinea flava]|uniref:Methyltransferase domain-containing protein n=1 Tax=Pseudochryseolinea flava TaxID=2059302 RepID=A0A364Y0F1_9BACT|nr:class I SAM-dependent methyltransferase [Pseudochryseolinea flava]RAV99382.1 hypothetical protein DQQ10_19350 [Pseudochryseolinea flava]
MSKFRMLVSLWRDNGTRWMFLYMLERLTSAPKYARKRFALEAKYQLAGFNTMYYNRKEWDGYDWSKEGKEWSDSPAWEKSIKDDILLANFSAGKCILEIGPGGAKWSTTLASISKELILVDISESALNYCKNKLTQYPHCRFHRTQGNNLSFLKDSSVDYIWAFDVFVHIAPADIDGYLSEFNRVLTTNGLAIIHHGASGGTHGGFRSSLILENFNTMLTSNGFVVQQQFDRWHDGQFSVSQFDDRISIFKKAEA